MVKNIRAKSKKPAYVSIGPFYQALELIRNSPKRETLTIQDLKLYNIAKGYEHKVISAFIWLGIIDEENKVTEKAKGLNLMGSEFDKTLKTIVLEAYAELLESIPLKTATMEPIINYFIYNYEYNPTRAKLAATFFVSLCERAGLELPTELTETYRKGKALTAAIKSKKNPKSERKKKVVKKTQQSGQNKTPESRAYEYVADKPAVSTKPGFIALNYEGLNKEFNLNNELERKMLEFMITELLSKFNKKEAVKPEENVIISED